MRKLILCAATALFMMPTTARAADCSIDLDIVKFKTTKKVKLDKGKPVQIELTVLNTGQVDEWCRVAILGDQNGQRVYEVGGAVSDPPGNGPSTISFMELPSELLLDEPGYISWWILVIDGDPDIDEATAVTQVIP